MNSEPAHQSDWIAVDWGTSRLRVWGIASDGEVLHHKESDKGAGKLEPSQFESALLELLPPLPETGPALPVVICGMAGSKQGWKEAPYAELPVSLMKIPSRAIRVAAKDKRFRIFILPGLCQRDRTAPDVIRGEETQLLGLASKVKGFSGSVCLPGTHSKWVRLDGFKVTAIQTYLTGELYELLFKHSILRHSVDKSTDWDEYGFVEGVNRANALGTSLLSSLFPVRANDLLFDSDPNRSASYLSGLLIGDEIRQQLSAGSNSKVALLGSEFLAERYGKVLTMQNVEVEMFDSKELTLQGLKTACSEISVTTKEED